MTEKDFFKSKEMFSNWRCEKYEHSSCIAQTYDLGGNAWFEKWRSVDLDGNVYIYIVEIFSGGNGFQIFESVHMR